MERSSVDLLNVDYDDVLNLYRGWKRSEGMLQNKSKELMALKARMKQLQESHAKFRNQIQALESVKELTVTLQSELSAFQQENVQLEAENNELARINQKAEQNLDKARRDIDELTKALHDNEVKLEHLRGRYEEISRTNAELDRIVSEEKASRLAAENRVRIAEAQMRELQAENKALLEKLNSTASRQQDADRDLRHAAAQLMTLSNEVTKLGEVKEELAVVEAEKDILKGDIARLIRLLEHYPAAEGFVQRWYDNQGLSFSGLDRHQGKDPASEHKGDPEAQAMGLASDLITPEEFAHLKRLHGGGDPFPMTASMQEESENWVPEETARLGVRFLDARLGSAAAVAAAGGPGGVTAYRRQVIRDFVRNANQVRVISNTAVTLRLCCVSHY
jgi:predicted RNase H-like nuclease (RuvC/YqgF family)